ncbi:MAG: hypothetical protein U0105_07755 [Candidatus Obscuribacterales bacterium]
MTTNEQQYGQVRDQIRKRQSEELSKKILSSMSNTFVGDETRAWLSDVSENVNVDGGAAKDGALCQLGMVELMDRLFDDFYRYAYQFNQTEESKAFTITCHRPKASNKEDASSLYQGSLLNSVRAMMVSGDNKSIRFAFIAPEVLAVDPTAKPSVFIELLVEPTGEKPRWSSDGKPLRLAQLPYLTKRIFARLMRVSRGEVGDTEPLSLEAPPESADAEGGDGGEQNNADVITYSLISILDAVDSEILGMQAVGMDALKKGGMEALGPAMKRVQALRAFREKTAALAQEWANMMSS